MSSASIFSKAFETIENEIPFNEKWENGTGYLDHVTKGQYAPFLAPGTMVKSMTPNGRRIIIIGTRFGNVAVFDRYIKQTTERGVFVTNAPRKSVFNYLLSGSNVGEHEMVTIIGSWNNLQENIGFKIEAIAKDFA